MGELLMRRRGMILSSAAPSEWDYEWYYTDGVPSSADGWTKTGADTPTMTSTGLQVNRSYFGKAVEITHGVIEAKLTISSYRTSYNNSNRAILRIGDSTNSIYVLFRRYTDNKIVLRDSSSIGSCTHLGSFSFGGTYTVRITINGAVGSVEINGNVAKDNIDTTSMYLPGAIMFGNDEQYGRSVWEYVKYKSLA